MAFSSVNRSRKVGRPQSEARRFFNIVKGKYKCQACCQEYGFKTATSNLTRHLKATHGIDLSKGTDGFTNMGYTGSPANSHANEFDDDIVSPGSHVASISSVQTNSPQERSPTSQIENSPNNHQWMTFSPNTPLTSILVDEQQKPVAIQNTYQNANTIMHTMENFSDPQITPNPTPATITVPLYTHMDVGHPMMEQTVFQSNNVPYFGPTYYQSDNTIIDTATEQDARMPARTDSIPHQGSLMDNNPIATSETFQTQENNSVLDTLSSLVIPNSSYLQAYASNTNMHYPELSQSLISNTGTISNQSSTQLPMVLESDLKEFQNSNVDNCSQHMSVAYPENAPVNQPAEIFLLESTNDDTAIHLSHNSPNTMIDQQQQMVASLSQALVPKQSANTKRKFNENDDDDQEILDLFRRRNFELLYEKMLNKNLTPAEIKEKLLIMMLENSENYSQLFKPSFKNFFTLVHPKFPPISLNINEINYEMLGRKKDSVRSILFEHCNCQWDPLLFDLFIFPLALKSELYANIELIHNDKNNHRRSCLIDMIHVPPNYPVEYLAFTICERLREFDVDQKVASVNVWGSVFDSALEDFLEKRLECRKKSRMITFSSENSDVTRRQYLAIRRGKLESVFDDLQFDLYVCLECLDKHEHLLRNLHETSKAAIPEIFQHCCKQIADQLNHVISPMTELENLTSYISIKIKEIKTQKANYVYYMRKGDPVNFLDVIPVKTYVESIKNVRCRLETLSSFLEQYDLMKTYHNRFDTNDLRLALEDIADVSSSDDAQQWSRKKPVYLSPDQNFFPACFDCLTKWRKVFYDGGKWSNEYKKLCVKFTKLNNVQSNVKSKYEDDLQVIAENVPDDMAHEKWRKAVFFKVWNKYENSYK